MFHRSITHTHLLSAAAFKRHCRARTRFQLDDPRTAATGVYADECIPSGAIIYGAGATVDESGTVTDKGKINGTVVLELNGWSSHSLTTLVFSILLAEEVRVPFPVVVLVRRAASNDVNIHATR